MFILIWFSSLVVLILSISLLSFVAGCCCRASYVWCHHVHFGWNAYWYWPDGRLDGKPLHGVLCSRLRGIMQTVNTLGFIDHLTKTIPHYTRFAFDPMKFKAAFNSQTHRMNWIDSQIATRTECFRRASNGRSNNNKNNRVNHLFGN